MNRETPTFDVARSGRKRCWDSARTLTRLASLLLALLCAAPSLAVAQRTDAPFDPLRNFPPELRSKLETPGDLTLRDSHLRDALLMISDLWDVDIAFTKEVTGDVNGVFSRRPLNEILDSILTINGYGYRPNGIGLVVQSLEELGESNPAFHSITLSLPVTSSDDKGVDQIVEGARMFLSKQGRIQAIAATRSMIVVDYPDRVARVQDFVKELSISATGANGSGAVKQIRRFPINHVTAEEIQGVLESVIGQGGTVGTMTNENVLVVYGPPTLIELAAKMIKENDVPRPQVRITAYIYDISLDETERFGVNWHHMGQGRSLHDDGMGADLFGFNSGLLQTTEDAAEMTADVTEDVMGAGTGAAAGIQAGSMVIRSMGANFSLESTIQALDETRGARLLASPQATVQHLEEATMKAVREVPFQQLTESTDGGAVGTTEFREAGITLTVTPVVAEDNTITLNVQPTFSVLAGFQEGQPIIDTREAKTRVRVDNGQIVVIGGLRQKSEVETVSGIPYLMHWKHFGKFFRAHATTIVESELVVFIKPEIVYPNTLGDPHDEAAANVTVSTLEQLPLAQDGPFIPYCHDPNCPYHHPRPRGVVGVPPQDAASCPHHKGRMHSPEKNTFANTQLGARQPHAMNGPSLAPPQTTANNGYQEPNWNHSAAEPPAPVRTPSAQPPQTAPPVQPPATPPQSAPHHAAPMDAPPRATPPAAIDPQAARQPRPAQRSARRPARLRRMPPVMLASTETVTAPPVVTRQPSKPRLQRMPVVVEPVEAQPTPKPERRESSRRTPTTDREREQRFLGKFFST